MAVDLAPTGKVYTNWYVIAVVSAFLVATTAAGVRFLSQQDARMALVEARAAAVEASVAAGCVDRARLDSRVRSLEGRIVGETAKGWHRVPHMHSWVLELEDVLREYHPEVKLPDPMETLYWNSEHKQRRDGYENVVSSH